MTYKQQKFIVHSSGGLEVRDQGASMAGFWWELSCRQMPFCCVLLRQGPCWGSGAWRAQGRPKPGRFLHLDALVSFITSFYNKLVSESRSVVSDFLRPHGLYNPWNSPGQNTGVSSLSLLQGIFPTQGSNPGIPRCRQILCHLTTRKAQEH